VSIGGATATLWRLEAIAVVATAACVVHADAPWVEYTAPAPIEVAAPPPPSRVEVRGPAPMGDGIWIAGHWEWRDGRYLWIDGRWERDRAGYVWVEPRYARQGVGWVYVRGHWRPASRWGAAPGPPDPRERPGLRPGTAE